MAGPRQEVGRAGLEWDDAHVPTLLRAVYGDYPVKLVVLLRDPVQRLEGAFWCATLFPSSLHMWMQMFMSAQAVNLPGDESQR